MSDINLEAALVKPTDFKFREVSSLTQFRAALIEAPALGPLVDFAGTFAGHGFNTIFRPDSKATPTTLPIPVVGSDNVLELNLTSETLSFSKSLGSVPNRGFVQGDVFLNGVPYLQTISDITVPSQPVGIHFEPGLWLAVPATVDPSEETTVVRMASIPHGTTVLAQGTAKTAPGKPTIPAVDITPFTTAPPHNKIPFPSQTATNKDTARIPQDLSSFITAGTITQAILDDPNTILRSHIATQNIVSTTTIVNFHRARRSPVRRGYREHRLFARERDGHGTQRSRRQDDGGILGRDRKTHHRGARLPPWPPGDDHPGRDRRGRPARPQVPGEPANRHYDATVDHGRIGADPVLSTGLFELQHADLATHLGSHVGTELTHPGAALCVGNGLRR